MLVPVQRPVVPYGNNGLYLGKLTFLYCSHFISFNMYIQVQVFQIWLRYRLKSAALEPVFIPTKKSV